MSEKAAGPNSCSKWWPTFTDLLAIFALLLAIVVWQLQPSWGISTLVAVAAISVVIFAAVRHPGKPVARIIVAAIAIAVFVAIIGPSIWKDFRDKEFPTASLKSPSAQLQSTVLKMIFECPWPHGGPLESPAEEAFRKEFAKNLAVTRPVFGLSFDYSKIQDGVRVEGTPNSPEGIKRLGSMKRLRMEARTVTDHTLITVMPEFMQPPTYSGLDTNNMRLPFKFMPIVTATITDDLRKTVEELVERSFDIELGKCRLL